MGLQELEATALLGPMALLVGEEPRGDLRLRVALHGRPVAVGDRDHEGPARIALPVADYAAIMVNGRVELMGEPADIADDVDAAYLGTTAA